MSPSPTFESLIRTVEVGASGSTYAVHVGPGAASLLPRAVLAATGGRSVAVISDSNVAPLHAEGIVALLEREGFDPSLHTFPAGEVSKTRATWASLTDALLEREMGRDGCVVTVGGGVTTDLGGFVAATYMRGIPVVHLPSSSLAMIDAAVGGKTGVDTEAGKNLVGAFLAPDAVLVDTSYLETLPTADYADGLVEAFKHGAIRSEEHFAAVQDAAPALLSGDASSAPGIIHDSVSIKAAVVQDDEFESGLREILNFGHTIGHAIEAASDFAVGHGAAVAVGMILEARLGEEAGVTSPGTSAVLEAALEPLGLPAPDRVDVDRVVSYLGIDKKARGGHPRFVLLERVGTVALDEGTAREVPADAVRALLVESFG